MHKKIFPKKVNKKNFLIHLYIDKICYIDKIVKIERYDKKRIKDDKNNKIDKFW